MWFERWKGMNVVREMRRKYILHIAERKVNAREVK